MPDPVFILDGQSASIIHLRAHGRDSRGGIGIKWESQKIIKEAIDQRGDQLEGAVKGLSAAVDRLSDRQDKSLAELIKALAIKLSS